MYHVMQLGCHLHTSWATTTHNKGQQARPLPLARLQSAMQQSAAWPFRLQLDVICGGKVDARANSVYLEAEAGGCQKQGSPSGG